MSTFISEEVWAKRKRIKQLAVSQSQRRRAWGYLVQWAEAFEERSGEVLPAPAVFADDAGHVELEWYSMSKHIPGRQRHLTVCFMDDDTLEYYTSDMRDRQSDDFEGVATFSEVLDYIQWVYDI